MSNLTFVSYAAKDQSRVESLLLPVLRTVGCEPWFAPHKLRGGDDWEPEIRKALDRCAFFVVIVSTASITSKWVRAEVGFWLNKSGSILNIVLDDCEPTDLNILLGNYHHVRWTDNRERMGEHVQHALDSQDKLLTAERTEVSGTVIALWTTIALLLIVILAMIPAYVDSL